MISKYYFILIVSFLFIFKSYGQIETGGVPPSFEDYYLDDQFQTLNLNPPDILEEEADPDKIVPPKVGQTIAVYYTTHNCGTWTINSDGSKIWQLGIKVPGALALAVYYSDLILPEGSELFLYNNSRDYIKGAFTSINNKNGGAFATGLVPGDEIILEYFQPDEVEGVLSLKISEILYAYQYVDGMFGRGFGDSGPCEVNVKCPEGNSWINQKRGIARILLKEGQSAFWCTGSLINNARQDTTPYFLTANHCGENSSAMNYEQWIFYFNYESPTCPNPLGPPSPQSLTGSTLIARGTTPPPQSLGSDFKLLLLDNDIPIQYMTFFNGWSRENAGSSSGVGIHHPKGDIKKISTYLNDLLSVNWSSSSQNPDGKFWRVIWSETLSGHGVTEPGSSGSPIFDANQRIIGTLTGGLSACDNLTSPDFYGKFWYSWEYNGPTSDMQLKNWLDPDGTGTVYIDGLNNGFLNADFDSDWKKVSVGDPVVFSNSSVGNPEIFSWKFEGGNPETLDYTINNKPTEIKVSYDAIGRYTVSLMVSDSVDGLVYSDEMKKSNFIQVAPMIYPNPARDYTKLFFGKTRVNSIEVELVDIQGRLVGKYVNTGPAYEFILELPGISNGMYFLKYKIDQQEYDPVKLIIE